MKKPAADDKALPKGILTAYRKVVGIKFSDSLLVSIPVNWSISTSYFMTKRSGNLQLICGQNIIYGSYISLQSLCQIFRHYYCFDEIYKNHLLYFVHILVEGYHFFLS